MVKHTQTVRRQFADEVSEYVWPVCEIGRLEGQPLKNAIFIR